MSAFHYAVRRFGAAWLGLCAALALHVTDEALTGFLDVYNPAVQAIRQRLPFLPLPTFEFRAWLAGLIAAVLLLFALSVFAFRGARWMRWLAVPFGVLMLLNGLGHLTGSIYFRRVMPGAYSAPLLIAASIYLLVADRQLAAPSPRHAQAASTPMDRQ